MTTTPQWEAAALRELTLAQIQALAHVLNVDASALARQLSAAIRAADTRSGTARIGDELLDRMAVSGVSIQDVKDGTGLDIKAIEAVLHGDPEATVRDMYAVTIAIGAEPSDVFRAAAE